MPKRIAPYAGWKLPAVEAKLSPVDPARLLDQPRLDQPRLRPPLTEFAPREVCRLIIGEYELRYELRIASIVVLNLWHTKEDR